MPPLSRHAARILEQMEPNLGYGLSELRGFVPDLGADALREVMQELWIERKVERFGYSGWQRVRTMGTAPPMVSAPAATREVQTVKPEDLFDHDSFTGFFK